MHVLFAKSLTDDIATQLFKKTACNVFLVPLEQLSVKQKSEEYISEGRWLYHRLSDQDERSKLLTQRTCKEVKHPKSLLLTFTFIDDDLVAGDLTPQEALERKSEAIECVRNLRVKFKRNELPTACEYWNCLLKRVGAIAPERCSLIMIPSSTSDIRITSLMKDFFSIKQGSYPDLVLLFRENNWQKTAFTTSIRVYNTVALADQEDSHKKVSYQLVGIVYCAEKIGHYSSQFFRCDQWHQWKAQQGITLTSKPFLEKGEVKCMSHLECCLYKKQTS